MTRVANIVASLSLLGAIAAPASARIIPNSAGSYQNTSAVQDQWCVGGRNRAGVVISTTEVCVDYNGSLLATGGNANTSQTLGVSSLPWTAVYVSTMQSGSGSFISFTPNLSSNTTVNLSSANITQSSLGPCLSGSTIGLTMNGSTSALDVFFVGGASVTVVGSTVTLAVLVDGAYVYGANSVLGNLSVGNGLATGGVGGNDLNLSFNLPIFGLATGATHNVCLSVASSSGKVVIDSQNQAARFGAYLLP